jgi:hypothetical protein
MTGEITRAIVLILQPLRFIKREFKRVKNGQVAWLFLT